MTAFLKLVEYERELTLGRLHDISLVALLVSEGFIANSTDIPL